MILTTFFHSPVLLPEVIAGLNISAGKKYIDATIGGGGYALEIIKRGAVVLGIDLDKKAIKHVESKVKSQKLKVKINKNLYLVNGNFADLTKIASKEGFSKADGIIFDFGLSSYQIDQSGRGFSYERDEPLDMRIYSLSKITAADLVNNLTEEELYEIFSKFAEELNSRSIAQAISRARSLKGKIYTSGQLALLIEEQGFLNGQRVKARIFQALRIAVNNELEKIKSALGQAIDLLDQKGRIAVLSYHSLEDRIVKRTFQKAKDKRILNIVTGKPLRAGWQETKINPRAKSARLRIAERK